MSNCKCLNIFFFILGSLFLNLNAAEIPLGKTGAVSFKENKGQIGDQFSNPRPDVLFTGNSGNLVFHLRNTGVSYQLYRVDSWNNITDEQIAFHLHKHLGDKTPKQTTIYRLDIDWVGANSNSAILKQEALPGYDNYYTEVCPNGVTNVSSYKSIVYQNLYTGINLKWYEKNGNLKYDYIVAPGADHSQIKLNIKGATNLSINKKGELIIKTPLGKLTEQAPLVMQGGRKLKANWVIDKNIISFNIEGANASQELIIDPLVRLWGTYYGGSMDDHFWYSVADPAGNVYATGSTRSSNNIATTGAHQTVYGGGSILGDAVLVKFDQAGVRSWGTYYGGAGDDYPNFIAGNAAGNYIAMTGNTSSTLTGVISTPGSHQPNYAGQTSSSWGDAFLVLFDNNGVRQWGTYYGGSGDEWGSGCSFDLNNNIYITGESNSPNNANEIATPGCHQYVKAGGWDGFIAKFNVSGTRIWGTFYGGTNLEAVISVTADAAGNTYYTGHSSSASGIATPVSFQPIYGGASSWWGDAFIAKFDPNGNRTWATYYGGAGDDWAYNCVLDATGNIYVAGTTSAPSQTMISTPVSHQMTFGGGPQDAFLLKLTNAGTRQWCTFYGGTSGENNNYCSLDISGDVYLTGVTTSGNAISTPCAYQQTYAGGGGDAYLARFTQNGNRVWGTYYGGTGTEDWPATSSDQSGNVFMAGSTGSSIGNAMSSSGSHQSAFGGSAWDGFLVKFNGCIPLAPPNTTNPANLTICQGKSTVLTTSTTCNVEWFNVPNGGTSIGIGTNYSTSNLFTTTTFYVAELSCGTNSVRTAITITVNPTPNFSIAATSTVICVGGSATLTPLGASNGFTWTPNSNLNASTPSLAIATPSTTQTYFITGNDGLCQGTGSVMITVVPSPTVDLGNQVLYLCSGKTATLTAQGAASYTWSPASSINFPNASVVWATPMSNTIYTVTGANTINNVTCTDTKSITIYVVPYLTNATVSESVTICLGQQATLRASGGAITTWGPIDNMDDPNGAEVHVTSPATTIYSVSISDNGLCPVTRTVLVQVNPLPVIDAGRDTTFNSNEPMYIAAIGSGTITWIGGPSIYCKHCLVTQVFPSKDACYTAEAINEFGCKVSDEICIEITKDHFIYIPNSFTPNSDGLNDEFKVYGDGISIIKMAIYDRWGKEVYFKEAEDAMWDGTYNGEVCEEGAYVYRFLYRALSGQKIYKMGSLTLLKD
jgi:gliding motility-associated-like protein